MPSPSARSESACAKGCRSLQVLPERRIFQRRMVHDVEGFRQKGMRQSFDPVENASDYLRVAPRAGSGIPDAHACRAQFHGEGDSIVRCRPFAVLPDADEEIDAAVWMVVRKPCIVDGARVAILVDEANQGRGRSAAALAPGSLRRVRFDREHRAHWTTRRRLHATPDAKTKWMCSPHPLHHMQPELGLHDPALSRL